MAPLTSYLPFLALILPSITNAHGHVTGIVSDGVWYTGWNAEMKYKTPIPPTAGWQADNLDNAFIAPSDFAAPNIICHKSATPGTAYVPANPGSKITFQWNTWPVSHKGPVFDYIAPCGDGAKGDCTTVDKTTLKWVKMDQGAWKSGSDPGSWVTDDLIKNNISWGTTIPSNIAPGNYVIRHEIIALHAAASAGGAQAYPQCVNFKIGGSGSQAVSGGVSAEAFYTATDPGIKFDLYSHFTSYTVPGPGLDKTLNMGKRAVEGLRGHARDWMWFW